MRFSRISTATVVVAPLHLVSTARPSTDRSGCRCTGVGVRSGGHEVRRPDGYSRSICQTSTGARPRRASCATDDIDPPWALTPSVARGRGRACCRRSTASAIRHLPQRPVVSGRARRPARRPWRARPGQPRREHVGEARVVEHLAQRDPHRDADGGQVPRHALLAPSRAAAGPAPPRAGRRPRGTRRPGPLRKPAAPACSHPEPHGCSARGSAARRSATIASRNLRGRSWRWARLSTLIGTASNLGLREREHRPDGVLGARGDVDVRQCGAGRPGRMPGARLRWRVPARVRGVGGAHGRANTVSPG